MAPRHRRQRLVQISGETLKGRNLRVPHSEMFFQIGYHNKVIHQQTVLQFWFFHLCHTRVVTSDSRCLIETLSASVPSSSKYLFSKLVPREPQLIQAHLSQQVPLPSHHQPFLPSVMTGLAHATHSDQPPQLFPVQLRHQECPPTHGNSRSHTAWT